MKVGEDLKKHLVEVAFRRFLDERGLAFLPAGQFVFLVKQLSYPESPSYERAFKEISSFFKGKKLDELECLLKDVLVSRPGVYATQMSAETGFPDYFVYEKKRPERNFFVSLGEPTEMDSKLAESFEVRRLEAETPEDVDVEISLE